MRHRFADLPIGRKIGIVGVTATATALVVSSTIFLYATLDAVRASVRTELETQASIAASNTAASLAFADPAAATETLGALRATQYVDLACLYDAAGRRFAEYVAAGVGSTCPPGPPVTETPTTGTATIRGVSAGTRQLGTLYLKGNVSQLRAWVTGQTLAAAVGIVLGILAAWLSSWRLQRMISAPILELSQTADRISDGEYSLRATRRGNDEIGELVEAFNKMVSEVARRDEQLRAAARVKDEFLAAISHELRTPLNAVLGWSQVLRTAPADPALTGRALASIERNALAQARLIEDLLDISRIVTGKLHFKAETIDLVAVIDSALEVVRPAASTKHITIARQVLPSPQWVLGDADRLQQVAWNLLSNAIKFTDVGGQVAVALREEAGQFLFEVHDTGEGLSPAFLPHVFDRFRQADGSLSRPHGGLGLGLAIARELVELHGGRIIATSPGLSLGSTFTVVLPAAITHPGPRATEREAGIRLDGLRVLVVDDDQDARELIEHHLAEAGADVSTARSASSALDRIASFHPAVIVCDLAMPEMDGYALLRVIREGERAAGGRRIPAIAVSAHVGPALARETAASGFDEFVPKPLEAGALLSSVLRVSGPSRSPSA